MDRKTLIHLPISGERKNVKIETFLPVIFLAGPIRNAPKWHSQAIKFLLTKNKEIFVASPSRIIDQDFMLFVETDSPTYETFSRQRAWEQYYLYAAAKRGCIIFWLLPEAEEKEFPDKVYAHITMMELGQWIARKKLNPNINLVIGIDENFPEWSTIKYEIATEVPDVPICTSLEETIMTALSLVSKINV
ncbi:MAG: hypothetical protein WAW11_02790 [Patescibacteria group bacterium]